MAISLVQSNNAVSSVNSPASIAVALPVNATANNLLLLVVGVTGTSPTITDPTGWTPLKKVSGGASAGGIYAIANTPGGSLNSTTVTVSATNGGAYAAIFEFSGWSGLTQKMEIAESLSAFTNTVLPVYQTLIPETNEFCFIALVYYPVTFTIAQTGEFGASVAGNQSSLATNNVRVDNYYGISSASGNTPSFGGSLSGGAPWILFGIRFFTPQSGGITRTIVSGGAGILVGQFNQGMIGSF